jgi:hypothetical protein
MNSSLGCCEAVNLSLLHKSYAQHPPRTFGALASVPRLAGLPKTVEQDDGVFMERDRPPVSFDLTDLGPHNARLSGLC